MKRGKPQPLSHPAPKEMALRELHGGNQELSNEFSWDTLNPGSSHFHSIQVFHFMEKSMLCPKFSHPNIPKSQLLTTKPSFSWNATIFICQSKGVLLDTLTTFSSQSAGICQNVLYLINMYNASSHILCQERVSMLQLISLICIQDYT